MPNASASAAAKTVQPVPIGSRRQDQRSASSPAAAKQEKTASPPVLVVPVHVPVAVPVPAGLMAAGGAGSGSSNPAGSSKPAAVLNGAGQSQPIVLQPKPMLEVKIHFNQPGAQSPASTPASTPTPAPGPVQEAPATPAQSEPAAAPPSGQTDAEPAPAKQTGTAAAQSNAPAATTGGPASTTAAAEPSSATQPSDARRSNAAPQPMAEAISAQPAAHATPDPSPPGPGVTPVAPAATAPATAAALPGPRTHQPPVPTPSATVPVPDDIRGEQTKAPLRSLSLEFTPDGASDIKVRLSEHAGDVHISLHGADASLAERVREGVSDLVGSLSKAGYDADAWTPDQGRQNPREQQEQRRPSRNLSGGGDAEAFSGMLQQPNQENS